MEKILISVKLENLDNKLIKIKVNPNKRIDEVLDSIVDSPKIGLAKQNEENVPLYYGLWFGKENVAIDEQKFEDAGIEEGDVLILRAIIGENEEDEKTKLPFFKKINKKQAAIISVVSVLILTILILITNWNKLFPEVKEVVYNKNEFVAQYMGYLEINGTKKLLKLNIIEVRDDWVIKYDLYIDKKPELKNKKAKIEPLNNKIIFFEMPEDTKVEKQTISKLDNAKFSKTDVGKIQILLNNNCELIQL